MIPEGSYRAHLQTVKTLHDTVRINRGTPKEHIRSRWQRDGLNMQIFRIYVCVIGIGGSMDYIQSVQHLRSIRANCIAELADKVEGLVDSLIVSERAVIEKVEEFHDSQRTFRVSNWYQVDWVLPKPYSTAVALQGPYLSECKKVGPRVNKQRINDPDTVRGIMGADLVQSISTYREAAIRLGKMAADLDMKSSVDRSQVRKSERISVFRKDRDQRIRRMPDTVRGLRKAIDHIDLAIDDSILDFNAIEGKRKRYGSFLTRWEVPSKLPQKTLAGPAGPSVFYIAFNRGKRMSAPIAGLYRRVHQRNPKGETPLTRQMIQKSRLGKFSADYRSAYKDLGLLRAQRNEIIEKLKDVQKRVR